MGTTNVSVEIGKSIEITVGDQTINVDTSDQKVDLEFSSITTANYVEEDQYFYLNGQGGNVKFKYNSTTGNIEFYIADDLVHSMAPNDEENPFA